MTSNCFSSQVQLFHDPVFPCLAATTWFEKLCQKYRKGNLMNTRSRKPALAKASRSSWREYPAACHHHSMRILVIQFFRVLTTRRVPSRASRALKADNACERSGLATYSSIEVETIRS